jgi:hypothetical protein
MTHSVQSMDENQVEVRVALALVVDRMKELNRVFQDRDAGARPNWVADSLLGLGEMVEQLVTIAGNQEARLMKLEDDERHRNPTT